MKSRGWNAGLVVLEIIVGIAPLLGLVGTIVGMMSVFGDVGQAGLTDAAKLAQGISLILRATCSACSSPSRRSSSGVITARRSK